MIRDEQEHADALLRISELFNVHPKSAKGRELERLIRSVEEYEKRAYPIPEVARSKTEQTTEDDQIGDATKMIDHGPTRSKMGTVEARMQHAAQMERATGKESLTVRPMPSNGHQITAPATPNVANATQYVAETWQGYNGPKTIIKGKGSVTYSNAETERKFKPATCHYCQNAAEVYLLNTPMCVDCAVKLFDYREAKNETK